MATRATSPTRARARIKIVDVLRVSFKTLIRTMAGVYGLARLRKGDRAHRARSTLREALFRGESGLVLE